MFPHCKSKHALPKQHSINWAEETCWQRALKDRGDRLANMYRLSKFSDLTITFPGHQEKLKVHRLVLSMSSPVFEVMFYGHMAEGETLELPADPPEAFKWLIDYIYCGITKFSDVDTAVQVYHLGHKYQIEAVSSLCSKYLQENLKADNLPLIYDTALLMEDKPLQHKCSQVVKGSADAVLKSSNIGQLSKKCMGHLLQQNLNVSSEVSVFKGLINWGNLNKIRDRDTSKGHNELRQTIEELLPCVRFLTMTLDEFVEHVIPSNILTSDECTAILMNIRKSNAAALPKICSQMRNKRLSFTQSKIHKVSLDIAYNNHYGGYRKQQYETDYEIDTRQCIVSKLKVTKDIFLRSIEFANSLDFLYQRLRIEVTDSTGVTLGEIEQEEETNNVFLDHYISNIAEALFKTPIFLSSNETYDIWLHCRAVLNSSFNISSKYHRMHITGCLHHDSSPEIAFWFSSSEA